MKAVFFNDSEENIRRVYTAAQQKELQSKWGVSQNVYGKKDLPKLQGVQAIFSTWGMPVLSQEEIQTYLPALEAVFYAAGSVQAFAKPFLASGVRVFSAWQANAVPVAEYVVSQILLATKGYWYLAALCKRDYAAAQKATNSFVGNFGAKVGILGYGAIAKRVVRALAQHDVSVYVCAPDFTAQEEKTTGAIKADMPFIFSHCDVISNHIPDNPHTKGIIGRELLFSLKPYATFINTGRGAQVDENALAEKLLQEKTVTALLDVTFPEPPREDSKLYACPNAVLSPHMAGSSGQEVHRMAQYMIDEAERVTSGKTPLYEITADMLEFMA